jgi:membrane protease YdiL (CAAX protease family)
MLLTNLKVNNLFNDLKGRFYNMVEKSNHHNERNVCGFFLLTFMYSWSLWLPFVLSGIGIVKYSDTLDALRMPAVLLGAFAPLLSAVTIIARRHGWSEVKKYILQVINLRTQSRYFALAFLLPLIITAAAHYIANFTGLDNLPRTFLPENLPIPTAILIIPYFFLMLIIGGGQEEFGWRGYAQEPLQDRFGVIGGSVVLGVVWGLWHLPLWFMPGDGHAYYSFFAFLIFTIGTSLIMACIYNASGKKVITTWIMHAMSNTVVPFFPIMHMENVPQPGYWLWVGLNSLAALGITIWFYNKRKDRRIGGDVKGSDQQYFM